jgi:hypothetical protein
VQTLYRCHFGEQQIAVMVYKIQNQHLLHVSMSMKI